jgi:hypothetical protein
MSTAAPTPEPPRQTRMSLFTFIEINQRLLTAIAVFVALTAFLIQATAGDDLLSKFIPGIPLFGALLLILELFLQIPVDGAQKSWRLLAFELVVMSLGAALGWMWFERFPTARAAVLLLIFIVLFLLVVVGLTYLLSLLFGSLLKRVTHRKLRTKEVQGVYFGSLFLSAVLIFGGLHWATRQWGMPEPPKSLPVPSAPVPGKQ